MASNSQVASLVKSITEYKDFKQMAGYNISCLISHIDSKNVKSRDNIQSAVECNAIPAIVDVLRTHKGSPDVLKTATEALRKLVNSPENAALVASSGALAAALNAIGSGSADPSSQSYNIEQEDLANEAAALLKTVAQYNPDAILEAEGGLESIIRALRSSGNSTVQAACAEVLDRIGRSQRGMEAILRLQGVEAMLAAMAPGKETTEEMLRPMFRLLERMAKDPDTVALIRQNGGVEALVAQLEAHADNDAILRAGGRLLGIVAAGDLEDAIMRLKQGNLSEKVRLFTTALLSNLALQPENIDKIIDQGGVKALISNFSQYNPQTQEAAARALGRLANNEQNAAEIINAGGLKVLVSAIRKNKDNPDVIFAASQAIAKIAVSSPDHAAAVEKAGGFDEMMKALANNPGHANLGTEVMNMISKLASIGYDVSCFASSSHVKAIVASMQQNIMDAEVQLAGNKALLAIAECKEKKAASNVIGAGGAAVALKGMEVHRENSAVVQSAMQLFAKLLNREPKSSTKVLVKGLPSIVSAVYAQIIAENRFIDTLTQQVLKPIVSVKHANAVVDSISSNTKSLCSKKSDQAAADLEASLMAATVYSKLPSLAEAMVNANAAPILTSCMKTVVKGSNIPDQFSVISAFAHTIKSFVTKSNRKFLKTFQSHDAIAVLLESIRVHATQPEQLIACLGSLQAFAAAPESKRAVVDEGGIEACVGAIRANSENEGVLLAAVDVLLQLATFDDIALEVAYKGGTRQVIKTMIDNCGSEAFETPIERCLLLLERVAAVDSTASGEESTKKILTKQGAVNAVTKVMEAYPESETIEAIGARVLSRLLDREGVEAICDKVISLSKKLKEKKSAKVLPELARAMTTVGYLSLSPTNDAIIREKRVAPAMLSSLKIARKMEPSKDREQALRAGLRALGQMSSIVPHNPDLGVEQFVIKVLKDPSLTIREKMGALDSIKMMGSNETTAKELMNGKVVETILQLLKDNPHDEGLAIAGFGALAAIAEHEAGAKKITKCGGTELALQWLKDNAETSSPKFAEECMTLLSNLALLDSNVSTLVDGGVIDTVITVFDTHCSDPSNPQPRVLNAGVSLLGRIAVNEDIIRNIVQKGATKRVIEIANSSPVYLSDADCMEAVIFLIESCALVEDVRHGLVQDGAIDMIMAAMNLNSSNQEVVVTGSRALQALMGQSSDTVQALLKDIEKLAVKAKKNPTDTENLDRLEIAMRNLSNLALVDGLLKESDAATISRTLCQVLGVINELPDGPRKQKLVAAAVQALGRVQLVGSNSSKMDKDLAISTLVDILKKNKEDPVVQEAALFALGNACSNAEALRVFQKQGGFQMLKDVIVNSTGDAKVHEAAVATLNKIRETALENVKDLASDEVGIEALAGTIDAHAYDPTKMRACIEQVAAQKGGLDALLSVLGSETAANNPKLQAEIIEVLREQCEKQDLQLEVATAAQMKGLLRMLKPSANRSAAENAERRANALGLMSYLAVDSADLLVQEGGVEAVMKLLSENMDDPDVALQCLQVLNNAASSKNPELMDKMVKANIAGTVAEVMKRYPRSEPIAKEGIELLHKLAFVKGVDNSGMDAEMMRLLAKTVDKFAANPEIQHAGNALVDSLSEIYHEDGANMISSRLDGAMAKLSMADDIVECYDEKGRVYYFNRRTNETTWEKPQEYATVMNALEGVAKLTEAHKDNISSVNPDALKSAVKHMSQHPNEPARLTALAKALATLATNDENRAAIANAGGLQAIIQALNGDNVDPEFLVAAISLLNQFARNDFFKEQICQMGGVKALIKILVKFIDVVEVVEKCLSALANLAFNSPMNMKQIMACKGVDAVEKVMKRHPDKSRVLQLTMVLLSNLMFGNDENKLIIGQKCGDEIVNVIRVFFRDLKLFKGAMRALGNLSYCDENIRWIVENGATKCIVAGMVANKDNIEAQQIAIDVIGNFASLQEDDVREKIARGELQSVYEVIVIEGGAARILETVQRTNEPQLLMSGMDALSNLANDPGVTEKLIKMGIVNVVIDAMQKYDWDEDLMDRTVRLMAILTYSDNGVKAFGKRDGVQVLLSAMETHANQIEFLTSAATALKNIAGKEDLREEIGKLGGIEATLSLVERNVDSKPFLLEVLALYIRLTRSEHLSEQIAQKGMHVILKTIHTHEHDAKYLTSAFTLLGHLAFAKKNLKIIVQYGGIGLIINSICEHPDSRELMTRSIQTLDNIAMASPEHAKIVIREGGDVTIREVIAAYADDKEVVQYGNSALLSMTALEKRPARKPKRIPLPGTKEANRNRDPLEGYRNMLLSGALMTEWSGGGPHTRHLLVSRDWKSICWKDPKKSNKSGNLLPLRDVRQVRLGASDGHKKGRKKADPNKSFSIVGRASTIDMECNSQEDRDRWHVALKTLVLTKKQDPRWLK